MQADPDDRRAKRILPTKAARKIFERRNADDYDVVAGWFGAIDDRETREFLRLLRHLARDLPDRPRPSQTRLVSPRKNASRRPAKAR